MHQGCADNCLRASSVWILSCLRFYMYTCMFKCMNPYRCDGILRLVQLGRQDHRGSAHKSQEAVVLQLLGALGMLQSQIDVHNAN